MHYQADPRVNYPGLTIKARGSCAVSSVIPPATMSTPVLRQIARLPPGSEVLLQAESRLRPSPPSPGSGVRCPAQPHVGHAGVSVQGGTALFTSPQMDNATYITR